MAKSNPNPEEVPLNRLKVTRISKKHRVSSSEVKARIEGSLAQLENKICLRTKDPSCTSKVKLGQKLCCP